MFAYYDSDADIAWFPTGASDDVVSERVPDGLRDYDRASHKLVAIEVGTQAPDCPRASWKRSRRQAPPAELPEAASRVASTDSQHTRPA